MMNAKSAKGLSHSLAVFRGEIAEKRKVLDVFEEIIEAVQAGYTSTTVVVYQSYADAVIAETLDLGFDVQTEGTTRADETIVRISW